MGERNPQVPVSMDVHLLAALDAECVASERNRAQVVRYALRRYLLAQQQRQIDSALAVLALIPDSDDGPA